MRLLLSTLIFFLSLPCPAKERGFDLPLKVQERKAGLSRLVEPPQQIGETCWAYSGFALFWQEDPGIKGIEKITLREGSDPAALCSENYAGLSRPIATLSGWPLGVAGPFLLMQDEPLGNLAVLYALKLSDGKVAFTASRDVDAELVVEKKSGLVSLRYYAGLEPKCVPTRQNPACWERIKADHKIPPDLALPMPDCEGAFRKEPIARDTPAALAISVPVLVRDLSNARPEFLPGRARCAALP